ncbi:hypothetical protein [Azospirillum endophyticum]
MAFSSRLQSSPDRAETIEVDFAQIEPESSPSPFFDSACDYRRSFGSHEEVIYEISFMIFDDGGCSQ